MPTIFIALQCCQCSTMQVKQQKKSSNKWSCVVCNQKQSVRKVYAQGFMAKDVRKFVQSFNMSRQLAEQNQLLEEDGQNENLEVEDDQLPLANLKNKRTDWSEYIDPPEEEDEFESRGDGFEPQIVTEIPKALFKRPLKNYSAKVNTSIDEGENFEPKIVTEMPKAVFEMPKSVFKKPKLKNYSVTVNTNADQVLESGRWHRNRLGEAKELQPTYGTSKWKSFSTQEDDDKFEQKVPLRNHSATTKSASKWSCYITEETDDLLPASGRGMEMHAVPFEINELNDQKVEDDIHPDFLCP